MNTDATQIYFLYIHQKRSQVAMQKIDKCMSYIYYILYSFSHSHSHILQSIQTCNQIIRSFVSLDFICLVVFFLIVGQEQSRDRAQFQ